MYQYGAQPKLPEASGAPNWTSHRSLEWQVTSAVNAWGILVQFARLQIVARVLKRDHPVNQDNIVNQFINQFNQAFIPGAQALGEEMQMQVRSAMTKALKKMDLVTREEFDIQQAVLQRSREKLDALETQISGLEDSIHQLRSEKNDK